MSIPILFPAFSEMKCLFTTDSSMGIGILKMEVDDELQPRLIVQKQESGCLREVLTTKVSPHIYKRINETSIQITANENGVLKPLLILLDKEHDAEILMFHLHLRCLSRTPFTEMEKGTNRRTTFKEMYSGPKEDLPINHFVITFIMFIVFILFSYNI